MNGTDQHLITQSRNILTRNWLPSLILGLMGLLGLAENLLIIGVILRGRLVAKAHHYFCVLNLAVADAFSGIVFSSVGLRRYILYATGGNEVSPTWRCVAFVEPTVVAGWATVSQTASIAIDRLFGVVAPMRYKVANVRKLRVLLNYSAWALALLFSATLLLGVGDWPLAPVCQFAFVFDEWTLLFSSVVQGVLETLVVVAYAVVVGVTYVQKRRVLVGGDSALAEAMNELSVRVAKSTTFILAVFVAFFVVPDCVYAALQGVDSGLLVPYYGPWYLCLQYVPCCLNLPIYTWRNRHFREELCTTLRAFGTRIRRLFSNETVVEPLVTFSVHHY